MSEKALEQPAPQSEGARYLPMPGPRETIEGLNRFRLYELARERKIRVVKAGRRSLVDVQSVLTYLDHLPAAQFGSELVAA